MQEIFSTEVFKEVQPILTRVLGHPFNVDLAQGTLSKERFCVYMQQDSLYLIHFSRALAVSAGRSGQEKRIEILLSASQNALLAERSLHQHYFKEYGVNHDAAENPACLAYSSYLLATASLGTLGESLAALLPCFWIYREVGNRIAKNAASPNPYSKWIETYSDKAFSVGVDRFVELTDSVAAEATAEERLCMKKRFMTSSQFEYFFWDDAYHGKVLDCTR